MDIFVIGIALIHQGATFAAPILVSLAALKYLRSR